MKKDFLTITPELKFQENEKRLFDNHPRLWGGGHRK
jgi:hypothetical protein